MELVIVRHAAAHDPDPGPWLDDSQRPLSPVSEARFIETVQVLRRFVPAIGGAASHSLRRAAAAEMRLRKWEKGRCCVDRRSRCRRLDLPVRCADGDE